MNETYSEADPYRDPSEPPVEQAPSALAGPPPAAPPSELSADSQASNGGESAPPPPELSRFEAGVPNQQYNHNGPRQHQNDGNHQGGGSRRGRRNRRGRQRSGQGGGAGGVEQHPVISGPPPVIVPDGATEGWFDSSRDAGFIRRAENSYLADPGDAYVGPHLVRQFGIRRGDLIAATTGHDHRGRVMVAEDRDDQR